MAGEKTAGSYVECICPKCGKHHKKFMLWTGTTVPRKFCKQHLYLAGGQGWDIPINKADVSGGKINLRL